MIINISNNIKQGLNLSSLFSSKVGKDTSSSSSDSSKSKSTKSSLLKGQKINLSAISHNINNIEIELGWQTNCSIDINAEAFLINSQDKIVGDNWFVFYNQDISPDGSVKLKARRYT